MHPLSAVVLSATLAIICAADVLSSVAHGVKRPAKILGPFSESKPRLRPPTKPLKLHQSKRPLTPYVSKSEKLASFSQRKPFRLHASSQGNVNPIHDSPPVSTSEIRLWNLNNGKFYGIIGIGVSGQVFSVFFDTCSSPMWITVSLDELLLPSYYKTGKYDSSSNNTNEGKPFQLSYSANHITGTWSEDVVTIGDIVVPFQAFGNASFVSDIFYRLHIGGVVGLGFRDIANEEPLNVFDNMVSQGLVQAPVFSFYMNRMEAGTRQSRIMFGGVNPEFYTGDFTYVDMTAPNKWQFKIDRVQLFSGMEIFSENGCQAEMDSTSTMIIGPRMDVIPLNIKLGGRPVSMPGPYEMFEFDCSSLDNLPAVQFIINGQKLSLSSEDYVIKMYGRCLSGFATKRGMIRDGQRFWRLGNAFMRGFYTQFDKGNRRIGFAQAKH
ncbi:cathepsin d [Plakobranchus ocellatus]|uniref:Cathepsin d n=1 Tax=Plakobranchus ocellatus TaxID=259542 RepID=A0AAV4CY22_9GAST|nr:cathepsin d [Plakobranchus ocellatus]